MPTVVELREKCKKLGIKGYSKLRKSELEKTCVKTTSKKKTTSKTSGKKQYVKCKPGQIRNKLTNRCKNKSSAKKVPAKKVPAKKVPAKKASSKPAKKAPAKKASSKPAKKAPAKKASTKTDIYTMPSSEEMWKKYRQDHGSTKLLGQVEGFKKIVKNNSAYNNYKNAKAGIIDRLDVAAFENTDIYIDFVDENSIVTNEIGLAYFVLVDAASFKKLVKKSDDGILEYGYYTVDTVKIKEYSPKLYSIVAAEVERRGLDVEKSKY